MINDSVNINETADIIAHMDVLEQAVIIKSIPTNLLIDELSDRFYAMEYKIDNIMELLNVNI